MDSVNELEVIVEQEIGTGRKCLRATMKVPESYNHPAALFFTGCLP